jgi:hypothetical protein
MTTWAAMRMAGQHRGNIQRRRFDESPRIMSQQQH